MSGEESIILLDKHCLVCFETYTYTHLHELEYIIKNFAGKVFLRREDVTLLDGDAVVYLCGNVGKFFSDAGTDLSQRTVKVVGELSFNYDATYHNVVSMGEVPLNVHNVGVYFRDLFGDARHFEKLKRAHRFQSLTESNKPGTSYRKGIYLSAVECDDDVDVQAIRFNLLRCSTNLDGPTDAFRHIDYNIVNKANDAAHLFFKDPAPLNHVLAQIYENVAEQGIMKEKKARIKTHSDKTKDMPRNGLIAFCTFYSDDLRTKATRSKDDMFDHVYKNGSVLTNLKFRLKSCVTDRNDLVKVFGVKLYPNSMFIIPLSTNRLYTHEISPPNLPINKIPTRLGYVIRCSKAIGVYKDGKTYMEENGDLFEMVCPTDEDIAHLKDLYFEENATANMIDYGNLRFSLNQGDYLKPNMEIEKDDVYNVQDVAGVHEEPIRQCVPRV